MNRAWLSLYLLMLTQCACLHLAEMPYFSLTTRRLFTTQHIYQMKTFWKQLSGFFAEAQLGSEKNSYICSTTSNSLFSPGSLPSSGNKKVGSWCHWQTPWTECWVKLGGRRREGHARPEFRHVYITAQDISQSLAKLLKFPGSRVAESWKEAQAFTYSSLPRSPVLRGPSHSSTPFASWQCSVLCYSRPWGNIVDVKWMEGESHKHSWRRQQLPSEMILAALL